jgi:hypothetical protein
MDVGQATIQYRIDVDFTDDDLDGLGVGGGAVTDDDVKGGFFS